ncbi:cyclic pyranopterin monophosphate synthase MoaC [Luteolibacter ambystomatis]|uniref:cyclic pyranopterin monophosphate synthase n=1 Tax=Luteolibacter ambystomatis TaxID=2824561 RepID=A0A975J064_9BACT|nr:cyclic pyranopterin monophosphate synthase MoaC [Luteolibacter ambystomatis]QUE51592.1 cyclic pyranopterin monophosphate synthase MoaC [Luteolibacter ambystomatis]
MSLSHINESNQAAMVDVSGKPVTVRHAVAEARITVNDAVAEQFRDGEFLSKKGPVFQTAILAGVMGAKQTPHLIPLCHPLPLEDCQITTEFANNEAVLRCSCKTTGRTGVEMEALTGATIAALTFFDMIKALDKTAVIHSIRVIEKTGGKSDILPANT